MRSERASRATAVVLIALAALVLAVNRWGEHLKDRGRNLVLPVPPLLADATRGATWGLLLPLATGACAIALWPRLESLPWRKLLFAVR